MGRQRRQGHPSAPVRPQNLYAARSFVGGNPGPSSFPSMFPLNPPFHPSSFLAPNNFLPVVNSHLQNHSFNPIPNPAPQPPPPHSNLYHSPAGVAWNPRPQLSESNREVLIDRAQNAAVAAHEAMLKSGETVSVWAVAQAVLVALHVNSWEDIGLQMKDVKLIHELFHLEGKVNALIHCFVGARMIASVYDLEVAICHSEGVNRFKDLSLGPLHKHPLVKHYFLVPSETTEMCNISSQEIVRHLKEFLDGYRKKKVKKEAFLKYIVMKKSVKSKEQLGLRIQNLQLYVSFIQKFRRDENNFMRESVGHKDDNAVRSIGRVCGISEKKKALDSRFDIISKRVESFSLECGDLGSKHVHFNLSADETGDDSDEDADEENEISSDKCVCSCAIETLTVSDDAIKKRKPEENCKCNLPPSIYKKLKKSDPLLASTTSKSMILNGNTEQGLYKYNLSKSQLERFITTWKETSREKSVSEVAESMLSLYAASKRQQTHMRKYYSTYPGIGLLNVAVKAIAYGTLDSVYDTIQIFDPDRPCPNPENTVEVLEIEPENAEHSADSVSKNSRISIDAIGKKVVDFFKVNKRSYHEGNPPLDCKALSLKALHECEQWLNSQFSAENFSSLGFGNFLDFLVNNAMLLPPEIFNLPRMEYLDCPSLEVSLSLEQFRLLLCPAGVELVEGEIAKSNLDMLLQKQFPSIRFRIIENKLKRIVELMEREKMSRTSKTILFSTSLLRNGWTGHVPSTHDIIVESDRYCNFSAAASSQEAIDCLLMAPMLSDLLHWSHWDSVFAPSLGPFLEWWLKAVHTEELSCIITRCGKFIRIESLCTVEQFLEACIKCSPSQVALKLLSLLWMYSGLCNAPVSLLRCYSQQAVDVLIKNYIELGKMDITQENLSDKATGHVAKFILSTLILLPSEFWSFAADILLSGLKPHCKNAYLVMLRECGTLNQRHMLHDIGFSLGITEWIEDYRGLFSMNDGKQMFDGVERFDDIELQCMANVSHLPAFVPGGQVVKEGDFSTRSAEDGLDSKSTSVDASEIALHDAICSPAGPVDELRFNEAVAVVESIRRDEFGLDPNVIESESCLLKKQHARLGRALQCLSQELYSQDSHLLLELVQNCDDNKYPDYVEPTLAFILLDSGVVLLNNEMGFSAENIRALCDIGNSTKKGSGAGYIGNKGIGFKSVFRVTDAPEIHSNGFHLKFDITQGQIGFVLPTLIAPRDVAVFSSMVAVNGHPSICSWNTCIYLPFRSEIRNGSYTSNIESLFSDLHPSLLLFLHRLKCIKFKNMIDGTLLVMRKEALSNGIVKVFHGSETSNWLVVGKMIQGTVLRHDVYATEIALAFTLRENSDEVYEPFLKQQPVFAFLPLRNYGLKFIVQGDFVLPSSREEVDGNSAWNQWLLSEFPGLFVSAENHFCALPCFKGNIGKAVTAFMSFVPLVGEVHGFFSQLPNMIISQLRLTTCLLLEAPETKWAYPCRALRGWDARARLLIPDDLLQQNLGLGYLSKDVNISDALAASLGVPEYGPKILVDLMDSLCRDYGSLESLGLRWLGAWLAALNSLLTRQNYSSTRPKSDILFSLKKLPFVPLSDGSFSSLSDGTIWLPCDISSCSSEVGYNAEDFPFLNAILRTVHPLLMRFSTPLYAKEGSAVDTIIEESTAASIVEMMQKLGVRKLCAHEIIKCHILPSLPNFTPVSAENSLMVEYLAFIMLHLQSPCTSCSSEKESIMSEVRRKPIVLTNYGYKCAEDEPIHFSKEYGNPVDAQKLFDNTEIKWIELDSAYLRFHNSHKSHFELKRWRQFFQELGVTDFVQVVSAERTLSQNDSLLLPSAQGESLQNPLVVRDWISSELVSMLSVFSMKICRQSCMYLLEILDVLWDGFYAAKVRISIRSSSDNGTQDIDSSFIKILRESKWIASSMDENFHHAKDLFVQSEGLLSLLGSRAPFCVPRVYSKMLTNDIGFKTEVMLDDALAILNFWSNLDAPLTASLEQMSRFYTFIWQEVNKSTMRKDIVSSLLVFVPYVGRRSNETVAGNFLLPREVFWHDPTGCFGILRKLIHENNNTVQMKMLSVLYPSLHEFFVSMCGVSDIPAPLHYLDILLQLSRVTSPSQILECVSLVFQRWGNDVYSKALRTEDISCIKDSLQTHSCTILPTVSDKWVSLHPSFGLICWPDDKELMQHFKNFDGVTFIELGTLAAKAFENIGMLMRNLDVPAISKVVSREAIYDGTVANTVKARLINLLLPYIQRYIYELHPDIYANVKENEAMISKFRIVVVKKLYCKYRLIGKDSSTEQFECPSILQENVLYATRGSDMHTVYLELSRLFFSSRDLPFANFLHMITTMAQSGYDNQQIEYFVTHGQRIPELPGEESHWHISNLIEQSEECVSLPVQTYPGYGSRNSGSCSKKSETVASSKAAYPSQTSDDFLGSVYAPYGGVPLNFEPKDESVEEQYGSVPVQIEGDWIIEDRLQPPCSSVLESSGTVDQFGPLSDTYAESGPTQLLRCTTAVFSGEDNCSLEKTKFGSRGHNENKTRGTGRLGEFLACMYFAKKFGSANVKWLNEVNETGLPYDLVISDGNDYQEFVEVKATVSSRKDWFYITSREWQFASERGDSFSIAHVVLQGPGKASIEVMRNPYKLCQNGVLRLCMLMTRQPTSEGTLDLFWDKGQQPSLASNFIN